MTFFSLVLKNLFRRKLRSCCTAMGVAIGVAAVTALLNFSIGFERSLREVYQGRDVDLVIVRAGVTERMTSSLKESLTERIRQLPSVTAINPSLSDLVSLGNGSLVGVSIHGWPADSFAFKRLAMVAGKSLEPADANAVIVGRGLAESLHKKVGDRLEIESRTFRIAGLFAGANMLEDATAIVLLPELQRLMDRPGQVTEFQVLLDPKLVDRAIAAETLRPLIANLRDERDQLLGLSALPTQQFVSQSTEVRLAHALAAASSFLALVIGGVGMFNTMTMAVLERTREIGVLRAIGWRRNRVWWLLFCESEMLCALGAVLGIVGGIAVTYCLSRASMTRGLIGSDISPLVLVCGLALALAIGVAAGIYPALRGASLSPVEAMRHE